METITRKPFQGVTNIIRFNWHYYAVMLLWSLLLIRPTMFKVICISILYTIIVISLVVSYYIYDRSNLYSLDWLPAINPGTIVNIHAGFDETSALLAAKYPDAKLMVFDFYDPDKHTEVSVKRARKAYPPYPGTISIDTEEVPLEENSADAICLILAAHEIRDKEERIEFFTQLKKALKPNGVIIVTEHKRDLYNFCAYSIGSIHFFSHKTWKRTFAKAGLSISTQGAITPFISTYTLTKC